MIHEFGLGPGFPLEKKESWASCIEPEPDPDHWFVQKIVIKKRKKVKDIVAEKVGYFYVLEQFNA